MKEFMTEDQVKASITYGYLMKKLWPYMKKHPWLLWSACLSVIGMALAARLLPTLIGQAIDQGLLRKDLQFVLKIAVIYLVLEVIKSILEFSFNYLFQKFGNRILFYIREDLVRHVERLPLQFFNKTPTGRTVTRMTNDVSNLLELFKDGVIAVLIEFIVILFILIAMLLISPKLTFIVLIFTPLFLYISYKISEKIRAILRESKKKLSELNSFVAENLSGIKVVQLYNRVPRNRLRFSSYSKDYAGLTLESIKAYASMHPVINLFTALTIAGALFFGGYVSQLDGIAIGSLVAFILHTQDFIPPLREILEKYQQFQNSLTSAERVFHLMDEAEENYEEASRKTQKIAGDIEVKSLSFRYSEELPLVLDQVSFQITAGSSMAIVGRTGSGKSTLISLLQRLYQIPQDQIFLDSRSLEQYSLAELRQNVAIVQQDNFIFRGSLVENISLGDPRVSEQKALWAAAQVGYLDHLKKTGRDLHFKIEERGANLSVGERQLIAFARILAFDPQIFILDEATANIDSQSESLIQAATEKLMKGRTSLIIAHRLSTVQNCDQILVLDQGRVAEIGTHQNLMAKKGLYAQMVESGFSTSETL
ncbi:MAG: ABC transporter ATP-binding protein [Pseudobdellovibrionaceae bacterium]